MTTSLLLSDSEVANLRAATPFLDQRIHLNHAGDSPSSAAVLQTQIDHLRRESEIGGYEAAAERVADDAAVYESIATMLGCRADEVARAEHATGAWNAGFWSVPMAPGQRIVTAEAAYGANAVAFLHAERVRGVSVQVIPSDSDGQVDLDALAQALDPTGGADSSADSNADGGVALVALTHVPTNGGLINPAADVGALTRQAGVPFLLDACQSAGQLDLDVDRLQCDLLSATGRKYLRGPRGTGFLYVTDSMIDRLVPSQPDHHGADWDAARSFTLTAGARRFEHWEYNHAAWLALGTAVDEALSIGLDRIEATVRHRADRLRGLLDDAGLPVFDLGTDRCGIVTTNALDRPAAEARQLLADAGINVSVTMPDSTRWDFERRNLEPMLRLSVHCTTTNGELDHAVETLRSL